MFELAEVERAGLAGGITCVVVGAGAGVGVCREVWVVLEELAVADGAVYCWPSSPGANVRVEQNPSDELMIRVRPSFDLCC